jgi:hypothetical protein
MNRSKSENINILSSDRNKILNFVTRRKDYFEIIGKAMWQRISWNHRMNRKKMNMVQWEEDFEAY